MLSSGLSRREFSSYDAIGLEATGHHLSVIDSDRDRILSTPASYHGLENAAETDASPDRGEEAAENDAVEDDESADERSIADADERKSDDRADETDSSLGGLDVSDRG